MIGTALPKGRFLLAEEAGLRQIRMIDIIHIHQIPIFSILTVSDNTIVSEALEVCLKKNLQNVI